MEKIYEILFIGFRQLMIAQYFYITDSRYDRIMSGLSVHVIL